MIRGSGALDRNDVSRISWTGDNGLVIVGYEKFTDPLLGGRSVLVSSVTLDMLLLWGNSFCCAGPRLEPRPEALSGGGDATRMGGASMLEARRFDCFMDLMWLGITGTGGASTALGTGEARDGDASRKVRSVMEPELDLRCKVGVCALNPEAALPTDDMDPCRRIVLLVSTTETSIGVVGRDRSAAAAAADESDDVEARLLRKAWVAAVVAEGFAVDAFSG